MTDNYWDFFLNSALSLDNPASVMMLLLLFLARILPIISQAPFFGSRVLPHPVKLTFAISLFAIFVPHLLVVTKSPLSFNPLAVALFAKELFVGYLIGFLISIPFTIVQAAGMFIDHQRGGASLMVNDPTIQNQSSPLGTIFNMVLIYIFFMIDGPFLFIDAIMTSYSAIPPDQFFNHQFFEKTSAYSVVMIQLLNSAMKLAIQFASPALIAILMTDVFLGIANRLATQVQITFLGLPLKSLLALTVITIGWQVLTKQMSVLTYQWLHVIDNVLIIFDQSRQ
jgi:type III secretion protein T